MRLPPPSLCIDLGAAFTKVAYRERPDAPTRLLAHPSMTAGDARFCVPSVAARDNTNGRWVFGAEAAALRSGDRIRVHQNWKADLFLPAEERGGGLELLEDATPEALALLLEEHPHLRAMDVASRFLCWLYDEHIPTMLGPTAFQRAQVTLCVPEFVRGDSTFAEQLDHVMHWAGFRNDGEYTLSEPRANLIGVLTRGENHLARGATPNLGAMFGGSLAIRGLDRPDHSVLFVDIGAFTTDLALANLARRGPEDGGTGDPSFSARLGVRLLDQRILSLAPAAEREWVEASAEERERFHELVYGGGALGRRPEEYGLTADVVDEGVAVFAQAILDAVADFRSQHAAEVVVAAVLTGGGTHLPGLGQRLADGLVASGVRTVHAPESIDLPPQVLRYPLGPELIRGASAIGGASILFSAR
jgi:hypothetical protein